MLVAEAAAAATATSAATAAAEVVVKAEQVAVAGAGQAATVERNRVVDKEGTERAVAVDEVDAIFANVEAQATQAVHAEGMSAEEEQLWRLVVSMTADAIAGAERELAAENVTRAL